MNEGMFRDCFGNLLMGGDDVIISARRNELCCGIVLLVSETSLHVSYSVWKDGEETTGLKIFRGRPGVEKAIKSLYKPQREQGRDFQYRFELLDKN